MMNVTLIRPPAYSAGWMGAQLVPFLGIAYVAAAAREAGYAVDIIDMCGENITRTEIVRDGYVAYGMSLFSLDKRLKPSEVIGFSCMFSQDWVFHRDLIRYVRKISPKSLLVAGGEQITALAEHCLEDCPELDICVVGEGEEAFVNLLDAIKNNKRDKLFEVPSLVYREHGSGVYCRTKRANRIRDIDKIPLPAWELTPIENYLSRELNYHIRRGRTIPMLASRGCPHNCTFCSNSNMWGASWVARDSKLIVDEMTRYIERYHVRNFVFSDLTAVVKRENIINLCNEIINRKIDITWQLPTLRTEAVDRGILELMRHAGCRDLDFAIESGSRNVLASVNKRNDPDKMFSLIKDGLKLKMNLSTNIIVGLPRERLKDFFSTYWMLMKLALAGLQELNALPFVPYPGSKLFSSLFEEKKIILNDDYFFSLFGYTDLGRAISYSPHFSPRTLSFMRLALLVNFYSLMFISHPLRVARLIINIARGKPTTKLEGVLKRAFRSIGAYFLRRVRYAG